MYNIPEDFSARMRGQLGESYNSFMSTYSREPERAIRVNTLKIPTQKFKEISPFALESVSWEPNGFYVKEEKLGKNPFYAAGLYYPQEPSAMCAVPLLRIERGNKVLDLCAAPGGKTTQIAQALGQSGLLIANEINFSRAKILSQNVERMGVGNCAILCAPPENLVNDFKNYFDRILVDAPCSGEGMFKKEQAAIDNWSLKNVLSCAERQSAILDCAAQMLAEGGRMVYSTCTFSPEEDEEQITKFLKRHPEFTLEKQVKLYPHEIRGEGHFAAALVKLGGETEQKSPFKGGGNDAAAVKLYRQFAASFNAPQNNLRVIAGTLFALPDNLPNFSAQCLRAGVRLGEVKKGVFTPDHALAMYLSGESEAVDLDYEGAINYLRGNTFDCKGSGWKVVTFKGYPLGWCKVSNGTAKNHYPKGLRF